MTKLFEEYPRLESERLLIHKMSMADANALGALTHNLNVYRYEPTFLYERKYDDPREALARMDEECFQTKESILMGIYLKENPDLLTGIVEIYAFEERKPKVSIGYRLNEPWWGRGIGTETAGLLRDYLFGEAQVRTITAHVLPVNKGSARILEKNGFIKLFSNCLEDWGYPEQFLIDKYVIKRRWLTMTEEAIRAEIAERKMARE